MLRVALCASAGDGRSTLIARLRHESEGLRAGAHAPAPPTGGGLRLSTECFRTERRDFLLVDCPGPRQHPGSTFFEASEADCALMLVDAGKGLTTRARRHSHLIALLGVRDVALCVTKIDLVEDAESRFRTVEAEHRELAAQVGLERVTCIPLSGLRGENIRTASELTSWHAGPTLHGYLDGVEAYAARARVAPLRIAVQRVHRDQSGPQSYAGRVLSGRVQRGEEVLVAASAERTRVARIVGAGGEVELATAGQEATLTLADELDLTPGDVIAECARPPGLADRFEATAVWMASDPMLPGRSYLLRLAGHTVPATVAPLKYKLDLDTLERLAATRLESSEIGVCDIEVAGPIAFDPYAENRETGRFMLIDQITNDTVGTGMISFALRRSENIRWQPVTVDKAARASLLHQRPTVLWLTGLSGAGKSTIANLVEAELHRRGHQTYLLDGDNVRHGLNADLGFTDADRVENIRRVAEVARLMVDAGLIVLVSFISPFRAERQTARALFEPGEFIEVFVDAPLAVVEQRDPKGLYRKARRQELINFTGIDSPYEPPESAELRIETAQITPPAAAEQVLAELERRGRLLR